MLHFKAKIYRIRFLTSVRLSLRWNVTLTRSGGMTLRWNLAHYISPSHLYINEDSLIYAVYSVASTLT